MSFVIAVMNDNFENILEKGSSVILTCILLFLLFIIKGLGAGDIKLLCVLASFYGKQIIWVIMASFLIGGAICILRMGIRLLQRKPIYIPHETIAFSVPILIGTGLITIWMYRNGMHV